MELRQLWAAYVEQAHIADAAWAKAHASRDAFDARHEPEIMRNSDRSNDEWEAAEPERRAYLDKLTLALDTEELGVLWNDACDQGKRRSAIIKAIRAIPAEGMAGIGIKLAALPCEREDYDLECSARAVLPDLDRLTGLSFLSATGLAPWEEYPEEDDA